MKQLSTFLLAAILIIHGQMVAQPHLVGLTTSGGSHSGGTVFKYTGGNTTIDTSYSLPAGCSPQSCSLVEGNDGMMYGLSFLDGVHGVGGIFKYDYINNTYARLFSVGATLMGRQPSGSLVLASNGIFYGLCGSGGGHGAGTIFSFDPMTNTYIDLYSFSTGAKPYNSLIQSANGKLYGLSMTDGLNLSGTIFEYDYNTSAYTLLLSLPANAKPRGSLVEKGTGVFYGQTSTDGLNGYGTVFKYVLATNSYTVLYNMSTTNFASFATPVYADSTLYCVSSYSGPLGLGYLFRLDTMPSTAVDIHDFNGTTDGRDPWGSMMIASDGKLYGMTGGVTASNRGVVYQYDRSTSTYSQLYNFGNSPSGSSPRGALTEYHPMSVPVITTQPVAQIVCEGSTVAMTTASSTAGVGVRWMVSTDGGNSFSYLPGDTNMLFSFVAGGSMSGNIFRAAIVNAQGHFTLTDNAALTVYSRPVSSMSLSNDTFSTISSGNYQWLRNGSPIAGANTYYYVAHISGVYQLVLSSNQGCSDTSAGITFSTSISAAMSVSDTSGCPGTCALYTDTTINTATSRVWTFPGGTPSSSTAKYVTVCYPSAGSYSASLRVVNGIAIDSITINNIITIHSKPVVSLTLAGDTFTASPAGMTYQWYRNGTLIGGAVSAQYIATSSGSYRVRVTNGSGCSDTLSRSYSVPVPKPIAIIAGNADTVGCQGFCNSFVDISTNSPASRSWSFLGGNPSSSNAATITVCYPVAGSYLAILTVTNAGGSSSDTVHVHVNAKPVPQIVVSHDTLTALPVGMSYQWYKGGVILTSTSQHYVATSSGHYTVSVTNSLGCSDTISINFTHTGIADQGGEIFSVRPNPFDGFIEISSEVRGEVEVLIYSIDGSIVGHQILADHEGRLNTSELANGLYIVRIRTKNSDQNIKMIKQN